MANMVKALVSLEAEKLLGLKQVCKVSTALAVGETNASRLLSKIGEIAGPVRSDTKIGQTSEAELSRLLSKIGEVGI